MTLQTVKTLLRPIKRRIKGLVEEAPTRNVHMIAGGIKQL